MLDNPQFRGMTPAPLARTAYDIRYENTLSPYTRAKYGIGGGAATSIAQLAQPRVGSGAASGAGSSFPQISQFSPSADHPPRLNPQQFSA